MLSRRHLLFLALCACLMAAHHAARWDWTIDDAAISYAYARNLVAGEGLVATPGGERIEGYSNPTWVLLLAVFQAVGLSGFQVAKPLALALSAGALLGVARVARRAAPEREAAAWIAPVALAANAQFAIWSMSGLENALFCFILVWGVDRLLAEVEAERGAPWSALWFLALAWTRPEGLLYGAVAGFWFLLGTIRRGAGRSVLWAAAILVPHAALVGLRYLYFAWPFPNTFYAKVGVQGSYPLEWDARGWAQLRDWAHRLWHGWYLPVYAVGVVGAAGWRGRVAVAAVAAVGLSLLIPGIDVLTSFSAWPKLQPPAGWYVARIVGFAAVGAGLPLLALGRPGGVARGVCAHLAATTLFFAVYANGDWMGGFRWMSLMAPTGAILFGVGAVELADRLERALSGRGEWHVGGWLLVSFLVASLLPPNGYQTRAHALYNRNETPEMVRRRGAYTQSVVRRTFYDEPVVNLEMDQGAHLWWFPEYQEVDMAGLVDIPMSRHRYDQRAFIAEYVLDERRPTFAHVHLAWGELSGFETYDRWHREMIELPPYEDGDQPPHDGVWARRSVFAVADCGPEVADCAWNGPRRVGFAGGVELAGFDAPVPTWAAGGVAYIEAAFRTLPRKRGDDVRVMLVLSNGERQHSWDLALGYGDWFPMRKWRADEVFVGRYAVHLPADLPPGRYDVGFVAFGPDGAVLPAGGWDGALPVSAHATTAEPRTARGEVRFPGVIDVVADLGDLPERLVADAVGAAEAGDCADAERRWRVARRAEPIAFAAHREAATRAHAALASCWARAAEGLPAYDAAAALARAHRWDPRSDALAAAGAPVGEALWAEGLAAREAENADGAYVAFRALLSFQPWRSWARRYAEEARDQRLGVAGLD